MDRFYFHVVEGAELLTDVERAHLTDEQGCAIETVSFAVVLPEPFKK